jgi:hypothetical protein
MDKRIIINENKMKKLVEYLNTQPCAYYTNQSAWEADWDVIARKLFFDWEGESLFLKFTDIVCECKSRMCHIYVFDPSDWEDSIFLVIVIGGQIAMYVFGDTDIEQAREAWRRACFRIRIMKEVEAGQAFFF